MLFTLGSFCPVTYRQIPYTIQRALTVTSIIKSRVSVQNETSYGLPWWFSGCYFTFQCGLGGNVGLIPGQGARMPHAGWHGHKIKT